MKRLFNIQQSFCNGKGHIDEVYLSVTAMTYGSEMIKNAPLELFFQQLSLLNKHS